MKNTGIKAIIKALLFILIFAATFAFWQIMLKPKWGEKTQGARETLNANGFYSEPENSIDVMMYGSSYLFFGVSPMKMWEDYGFTSFARGSANQSIYLSYYTIKDSLKYQKPKVIVLEIGQIVNAFDPIKDEWIARRGLDWMRFSPVKLEAIKNLPIDGSNQTRLSYIFPLLRYHSRWAEIEESDLTYFSWEKHQYLKGQYPGISKLDFQWPKDFMKPSEEAVEIPELNRDYFDKIVNLCRENEIPLLLVKTTGGGWTYDRYNAVKKLADEYQLPYIDYNLPENLSLTGITNEDFHYNLWHLRITGAEKLSVQLGEYLKNQYHLADRRKEKAFEAWNDDLEDYNAFKEKNGVRYYSLSNPELISISKDANSVKLCWNPVEHANAYVVYRKTAEENWVNLGQTECTEFIDDSAETGGKYIYTVKAINGIIVSFCDVNGLAIDLSN